MTVLRQTSYGRGESKSFLNTPSSLRGEEVAEPLTREQTRRPNRTADPGTPPHEEKNREAKPLNKGFPTAAAPAVAQPQQAPMNR